MSPILQLPYSPDLAPSDFFCFPDEKILKEKCFANVEEVKQNMAEALKTSKSTSSNTILSHGKNVLIGVLHQMVSTLKVTEI